MACWLDHTVPHCTIPYHTVPHCTIMYRNTPFRPARLLPDGVLARHGGGRGRRIHVCEILAGAGESSVELSVDVSVDVSILIEPLPHIVTVPSDIHHLAHRHQYHHHHRHRHRHHHHHHHHHHPLHDHNQQRQEQKARFYEKYLNPQSVWLDEEVSVRLTRVNFFL